MRSAAPPARRVTSVWPRSPPTCFTTWACCSPREASRSRLSWRCSMAVAASSELNLEPTLEQARELAGHGNVVPVRARFVDDCETPVSAFLKLRAGEVPGAPCFLLESAEQGQVGRYSFVGIRPRAVLRWSDGQLSERSEERRVGNETRPGCSPAR